MLAKTILIIGYLAICSLVASTWVDRVEDDLKTTAGKMAFIVVFLICPFIFTYKLLKLITTLILKPGDK